MRVEEKETMNLTDEQLSSQELEEKEWKMSSRHCLLRQRGEHGMRRLGGGENLNTEISAICERCAAQGGKK